MMTLPLKARIILLIVAVVLLVTTSLVMLAIFQVKSILLENVESNAVDLSDIVAVNIAPGLEFNDSLYIAEVVAGILTDPNIRGISVFDDSRRLVYAKIDSIRGLTAIESCRYVEELSVTYEGNFCLVERPIYSRKQQIGCMWLAVSKEVVLSRLKAAVLFVISGAIIILLAILIAGIIMADKIVRPIRTFEEAAVRISSGDMDSSIDLSPLGPDFISLGIAFNDMRQTLIQTFDQLQRAKDNLEGQVTERTRELRRELIEREKTQEELSKSRQRLMLHIQQTPLGVIEWDLNLCVRDWNAAAERIFGYARSEALGQHASDLIVPEHACEHIDQIWAGLLEHKGGTRSTNDNITRDGRIISCEWYNTPLVDNRGNVIGVASLVEDVTKRRQAEKALVFTQSSVDRWADAAYWMGPDARFFYVNEASIKMLGYSREEFLTMTVHDIDPNFPREVWADHWLEVREKGSFSLETLHRTKDGRIIPVEVTINFVEFEGKEYNCAFARDITEKKQAEKQKKDLQDQLDRAERMESLGILAGGVAHDLNNMLGPIVGYTELIMTTLKPDDSMFKRMEKIHHSAQDAADVIQDLLTLARRGRYEMAVVNVNDIIRAYLDSPGFIRLADSRPDIELVANLDDHCADINGSSPHLTKAIMNLVINAYDAMPEAGKLTISTTQQYVERVSSGFPVREKGEYALISIADTGIGIPPEDISKIFEPYYSKKKMGSSGSGLGLSVVYGVVKDHKGYYDIISEVGKGTTFILYFPVAKEAGQKREEKNAEIRGRESILVVDDVPEQRDVAVALLENLGYSVTAVENGRRAVEFVKTSRPDILVLDMIMEKDFDGLDTYEEIIKIHPDQKAIIVSGFSATDRVSRMQQLGAGAYIRKPYTQYALGLAVRKELDRSRISSLV